jgi:hypothetical protein
MIIFKELLDILKDNIPDSIMCVLELSSSMKLVMFWNILEIVMVVLGIIEISKLPDTTSGLTECENHRGPHDLYESCKDIAFIEYQKGTKFKGIWLWYNICMVIEGFLKLIPLLLGIFGVVTSPLVYPVCCMVGEEDLYCKTFKETSALCFFNICSCQNPEISDDADSGDSYENFVKVYRNVAQHVVRPYSFGMCVFAIIIAWTFYTHNRSVNLMRKEVHHCFYESYTCQAGEIEVS